MSPLQSGKKTVYLGHPRFIRPTYPYRRLLKAFSGKYEYDITLKTLSYKENNK